MHTTPPNIQWKDLRKLSKWQIAYNLILPYPFLLASWWCASQSYFILACGCMYGFYASAFRQVHDTFHNSIGINKRWHSLIFHIMSGFLLTSIHAIKISHMAHHRDPLADHDVEGQLAQMKWYQALLKGIWFRINIHKKGVELSSKKDRQRIKKDSFIVIMCLVVIFFSSANFLWFHFITITLANVLIGLVGVWGLHHDCEDERENGVVARTERNRIANILTFNLLYHAEHHLFPSVPSHHLPTLAKRIDDTAPEMTKMRVLPFLSSKNDNK